MDMQGILNEARSFVSKVEANPEVYKDALANGLEAVKLVQDVVSKLKAGDTAGAQATLTDWEDVNKTIAVTAAVADEIKAEQNRTTVEEVAQGLGAAIKVATVIAKIALG